MTEVATKRPTSISEEQEKQILELNHEGKTPFEISKLTGVPRTSLQRCLDYLAQDPNNAVKDSKQIF